MIKHGKTIPVLQFLVQHYYHGPKYSIEQYEFVDFTKTEILFKWRL